MPNRFSARAQRRSPVYDVRPRISGFGVEVECFAQNELPYGPYNDHVEVSSDGSVHGSSGIPYELKFGPMEPLRQASRRMDDAIERFRASFQEMQTMAGSLSVNSTCGLHIHIGITDREGRPLNQWWNNKRFMRMIRTWRYFEPVFLSMVSAQRRSSSWCDPMTRWELADIRSRRMQHDLTMNLYAMSQHGTIEFRLPEGTVDLDEICAWIKTLLAFVNMSFNTPLRRHAAVERPRLLARQRYLMTLLSNDESAFIARRVRRHRGTYLAGVTLKPLEIPNAQNSDSAAV